MSLDYAKGRIKEALKLCGGNQVRARQQVIAWTYEDAKLLHALAKPHLSGIVAYNIERVASGRADSVAPAPQSKSRTEELSKKAKKNGAAPKEEAFGMELLKAVTGSPEVFGLEDPGAPRKKAGVSKAHLDAIEALTAKSKSAAKTGRRKDS